MRLTIDTDTRELSIEDNGRVERMPLLQPARLRTHLR